MRRRGYTPEAIRSFCDAIGVAKANSVVDVAQLEHAVRSDLNLRAPRYLAVLDPLRLVVTNYPEGGSESFDAPLFPADIGRQGSRPLPFSRELSIERADFMKDPPRGYRRLAPGREVRLRYAYVVRCVDAVEDPASGEIVEVRCTYEPATRGGDVPDGRRVDGTIHWVSAPHAVPIEARLYDRLLVDERPDRGKASGDDFKESLNPASLEIVAGALAEPAVAGLAPGSHVQFERLGYFYRDPAAGDDPPVFNRTVGLRDTWARRVAPEEGDETPGPAPRGGGDATTAGAPPALSTLERATADDLVAEQGLREEDAERLARDPVALAFFRQVLARHSDAPTVASWVLNEVRGALVRSQESEPALAPGALAELLTMVAEGRISGKIAKDVLGESVTTGVAPARIVERRGLEQIADREALGRVVDEVLAEHADQLAEYRTGKTALRGFFVGRVMQATSGRAKPDLVQQLLGERLDAET
jgi:glutaminyl-tRNA synthetase